MLRTIGSYASIGFGALLGTGSIVLSVFLILHAQDREGLDFVSMLMATIGLAVLAIVTVCYGVRLRDPNSGTMHCPLCLGTNVRLAKPEAGSFSNARIFHDRFCEDCQMEWTPDCPPYVARATITVGTLLFGGWLAFTLFWLWGQSLFGTRPERLDFMASIKFVGILATVVGLPGILLIRAGFRALRRGY